MTCARDVRTSRAHVPCARAHVGPPSHLHVFVVSLLERLESRRRHVRDDRRAALDAVDDAVAARVHDERRAAAVRRRRDLHLELADLATRVGDGDERVVEEQRLEVGVDWTGETTAR